MTDLTLTVPAGVSRQTLRRWIKATRRRMPRLTGQISVATVSPVVSRRWNQRYRHRDRPTNVLSFVSRERGPQDLAGEIILCPAVIRREAHDQHRDYKLYFRFILQHGFLHLLGLDHRTAAEDRRWQRWEKKLNND